MEVDYTKLKILLIKKGIKQWELAKTIGVHETHLSKVMVGRSEPSRELVEKICKALNVEQVSICQR